MNKITEKASDNDSLELNETGTWALATVKKTRQIKGFHYTPLLIEKQSKKPKIELKLNSRPPISRKKNASFDIKDISFDKKDKKNTSFSISNPRERISFCEEKTIFSEYINKLDIRELDFKRSKKFMPTLVQAEESNKKSNLKGITKIDIEIAKEKGYEKGFGLLSMSPINEQRLKQEINSEREHIIRKLFETHSKEVSIEKRIKVEIEKKELSKKLKTDFLGKHLLRDPVLAPTDKSELKAKIIAATAFTNLEFSKRDPSIHPLPNLVKERKNLNDIIKYWNLSSTKRSFKRKVKPLPAPIIKTEAVNNNLDEKIRIIRENLAAYLSHIKKLKLTPFEIFYNFVFSKKPFEREGSVIFFKAVKNNKLDIIEILLKRCKYYAFDFDMNKRTPLHISVIHGNQDITKTLIDNGCDIDAVDLQNHPPLYYGITRGDQSIVKLLLVNRASPWSPKGIDYLKINRVESIKYLIKKARKIDILLKMTYHKDRDLLWRREMETLK